MRLIYGFLAIRMIRLARYDLARSDMLYRNGDEAFERSRDRVRQAKAPADRADLPSLASMR
ncbi:hypothetical protein [Methylobacterium sp. NEAU K]|uniref:hypothetical protein n=1 Tax=Methylobacterium sp. NEAU K TaxID=3064946 RepID=UPI00273430E6|nr:hypothetical protein [Methylobacterium sp. NEAU K]MDP4005339.1 hypothetical protein [Methylobacterium sp. NEAU K]